MLFSLHNAFTVRFFEQTSGLPKASSANGRHSSNFVFFFADEVTTHGAAAANPMPSSFDKQTTAPHLTYTWCIVGIVAIILMIIVIVHRLLRFRCAERLVTISSSGDYVINRSESIAG